MTTTYKKLASYFLTRGVSSGGSGYYYGGGEEEDLYGPMPLDFNSIKTDLGFNPNANDTVLSIALQSDGKFVIVGAFTTVGGVTRNRIARLNVDGTLDTSFNPDSNDTALAIAIQPDGKIIVGGFFTTVGGVTRNSIARLNSDGTVDTSFNPDVNNRVNTIALSLIHI